jgi:hypothetical protein
MPGVFAGSVLMLLGCRKNVICHAAGALAVVAGE